MGFSSDFGSILNLAGNFGSLGLIFWLVWRTTNFTIPRLAKTFEESLNKQRQDFRESMHNERNKSQIMLSEYKDFFIHQVEREREFQMNATKQIVDTLNELKTNR